MKKFFVFIVFFLSAAANAYPYSFDEIEIICPIDGDVFLFKKIASQRQFNTMLDGQPYGALVSPEAVPKCPKDGFIVFKDNFSAAEIKLLREYISSQEYSEIVRTETPYWLVNKIQERLSVSSEQRLRSMLYATWEAYTLIDYEKYSKYAEEIIITVDGMKSPSNELIFLKGELYRRLGDFDKAEQVFNDLSPNAKSDVLLQKKIDQQLGLIGEKISSTQRVER